MSYEALSTEYLKIPPFSNTNTLSCVGGMRDETNGF
jgi:hypothetical protein